VSFNPNIAVLALLTSGVGYLMVAAGLQKSALEWRRRRRFCPSCGRMLEKRVCSSCASA
jgi:NADH pyrophosphatase NudC (nudix superfamily)